MSLYTRLVSRGLFPLQERLKGHSTVAVRRRMEDSQWLPQEELAALQLRRLRAFLEDIGRHVPYYRELFRERGFQPGEVSGAVDLAALPMLDKATIRAQGDRLQADNAAALQTFNTGGSSGEPLVFQLGRERVSHDVAAKWRATRWWGVDIGDPELVVWGSPIELGAQDRVRLLRDALFRTRLLPAFDLTEAHVREWLAQMRRQPPAMLFGYPSAISLIAEQARRDGLRMDDLGIRVVFVTSERLYNHQRERIEACFGCPVANGYGGRDAGFVAHECPEGRLHITAEDILVEIVDEAGVPVEPGASGEIVVTHMATRDYPFVRYRTGDIGSLSSKACSCGRGLPVLARVEGRSTDFVVTPDGRRLHGLALIYVVREMPEVGLFKIVQESLHLVRVLVVPGEGFGEQSLRQLHEGLSQRLGPEVTVEIDTVESIAAEKSGKFRYIVSRVGT